MKSSKNKIFLREYDANSGRYKQAFIEIANGNKGGIPTWVDPNENIDHQSSIRRTVYDESGRFDIHSSPELPTDDIYAIVMEGSKDDIFSREQCITMIEYLRASADRR